MLPCRGCRSEDCDDCVAREQARRNPPRCYCCKVVFEPEDRKDDGEYCDGCTASECGERNVGAPCRAGEAS
jgi:hypothetical protein